MKANEAKPHFSGVAEQLKMMVPAMQENAYNTHLLCEAAIHILLADPAVLTRELRLSLEDVQSELWKNSERLRNIFESRREEKEAEKDEELLSRAKLLPKELLEDVLQRFEQAIQRKVKEFIPDDEKASVEEMAEVVTA